MSLRNIGVVYRKELMDSLRDRRTVISMVAVPLLLMPLLTIGLGVVSAKLVGQAMAEVPKVMILGGEDSPNVKKDLYKLTDVRVVASKSNYAEEISNKQIRAAVEIPKGFDAALASGESMTVKIYMYEGDLKSGFGADRLQRFFRDLRDRTIREHLKARQLPESLVHPFDIEQQNVAPPEKVGGAVLGGLVPYFVILLCLTGAMYPAMDLTAGEKERGTIETILCSPVSRTHLVLGKFLMVLTASLATGGLSIFSMAVSFGVGKRLLLGVAHGAVDAALQITISGKAIVSIFLLVVPLAVFFSAALLAISLFAKSFKEAQSYFCPFGIVIVLLTAMARGVVRRGAEHAARSRAGAQHEPGFPGQGDYYMRVPLELHRADFCVFLRLCSCGAVDRRENVSTGRCIVQKLKRKKKKKKGGPPPQNQKRGQDLGRLRKGRTRQPMCFFHWPPPKLNPPYRWKKKKVLLVRGVRPTHLTGGARFRGDEPPAQRWSASARPRRAACLRDGQEAVPYFREFQSADY